MNLAGILNMQNIQVEEGTYVYTSILQNVQENGIEGHHPMVQKKNLQVQVYFFP